MSDASLILDAKSTLAQALGELGVRPTDEAFFWLLGLVWGESKFGQSSDWTIPNALNTESTNPDAPEGPSHNWGAVRAVGSAPFIWHHDRNADGSLGTFKFARFPSALAGAKHFVGVLSRGRVPSVLNGQGSARDLAAAMFANHYFTGTQGTDDDRIDAYARMILSGAAKVRGITGAGSASSSPSSSPVVASGLHISLATVGLAVAGASVAVLAYQAFSKTPSFSRARRILA